MTQEAFARAADGARIRYRIWGDPASPRRVALVHALAMRAEFWEPVAARLGREVAALAVDCRGHGASDRPAGPYTVERFGDDLAAVLDDAGWERAVLGGASMGGCVAIACAARHPGRVAGLGLIDTTAWYGPTAEADWEGRARKALDGGMGALVEFQKSRWVSDRFREARPEALRAALDIFLANDVAAYAEVCRMLGRVDLRAALPELRAPTRVLVGEEDYATPVAMAEALAEAIPGATLEVIPGARHMTPLETPDVIAAMLRELATG